MDSHEAYQARKSAWDVQYGVVAEMCNADVTVDPTIPITEKEPTASLLPMSACGNVNKELTPPPGNEGFGRQGLKHERVRPRGSRTIHCSESEERRQTMEVHLDEDLDETISRGKMYSAMEAVQVARKWVEKSRKGTQKKEE